VAVVEGVSPSSGLPCPWFGSQGAVLEFSVCFSLSSPRQVEESEFFVCFCLSSERQAEGSDFSA
jgi:hypothetical protein